MIHFMEKKAYAFHIPIFEFMLIEIMRVVWFS